jgi:peptidoglycan/LPS O-acetylase OafA/YrhL
MGVELFFMISGFVIYMSMQSQSSFFLFFWSRFLRLAPAMLICSVIIYTTSFFILERPIGISHPLDLIPGMVFIDPGILNKFLGTSMKSLDGAFWSIYVEVKFYFIAAVFFYFLKDSKLKTILVLHILYTLTLIAPTLNVNSQLIKLANKYFVIMGIQYFGWFSLGIYTYIFLQNREGWNKFILFALSISNIFLASRSDFDLRVVGELIILLAIWFAPVFYPTLRRALEVKFFLFLGFASYPLYLLHQNITTGLAIKLYNSGLRIPVSLLLLIPISLVVSVSYLIAKLEPHLRKPLYRILQ